MPHMKLEVEFELEKFKIIKQPALVFFFLNYTRNTELTTSNFSIWILLQVSI